jgi:hypothetical protein
MTALTEDYLSVAEEDIKDIESVLTIVDGKIVYGSREFQSFDPAPLPVLPEWSPIRYYGGYGSPLDVHKANRSHVPISQRQHSTERHLHGCLDAVRTRQNGRPAIQ